MSIKSRVALLTRLVSLSAIILAAFPLSGVAHASGTHTITTCADLQQIDTDYSSYADTFVLGNDIDCNSQPILAMYWGTQAFGGTFDGQGHSISNFVVQAPYSDGGLFTDTQGATIKNLTLSGSVQTSGYAGGLVGQAIDTNIYNVHSSVDVTGNGETGGLVGDVEAQNQDVQILRSSATGSVTGSYGVGGLIGHIGSTDHNVTVSRSFATGYVSNSANNTGGLVGLIENNAFTAPAIVTLSNNYTQGMSDGGSENESGGIVGSYYSNSNGADAANLTISNSYASGGVDGVAFTGGIIGDVSAIQANSSVTLSNVFATGGVGSGSLPNSGAVVGRQDTSGAGGAITASGVYYDQNLTVLTTCVGSNYPELTNCNPRNAGGATPNYFLGNHTNAPMSNWDFSNIWQTSSGGFPVFQATPANWVMDDGDGITAAVENAAPNNGDGNNDGVLDGTQSNVASFISPVTGHYVTLAVPTACSINSVSSAATSQNSRQDGGFAYPYGMMNFTINCSTPGYQATVTQYIYGASAGSYTMRKYTASSQAYTTIPGTTVTPITIGGQAALQAVYTVTDGGALDSDGTANGIIIDPSGLGLAAVGIPNTGLGN